MAVRRGLTWSPKAEVAEPRGWGSGKNTGLGAQPCTSPVLQALPLPAPSSGHTGTAGPSALMYEGSGVLPYLGAPGEEGGMAVEEAEFTLRQGGRLGVALAGAAAKLSPST